MYSYFFHNAPVGGGACGNNIYSRMDFKCLLSTYTVTGPRDTTMNKAGKGLAS